MQLMGLAEPVQCSELDPATRETVRSLIARGYPGQETRLEEQFYSDQAPDTKRRRAVFLGRSEGGRVIALGRMSALKNRAGLVAHIHEVVVDETVRLPTLERNMFFRLTSWAGAVWQADLITLDDRVCLISKTIFPEAMFSRRKPADHIWRCIPAAEEDK